ncbi:hypothetical protein C8R44DRAFT_878704 [Mycena epipterygia]|nr:hypothetical protein C8R44DRAFT_878704 [Mycena epipterygia]
MTSTSTSNTSNGHVGLGTKIKGATQAINGLGENVRGTILGGVDTVLHQDSTPNDAIAAKGRAQHAEGLAKMQGRPLAAEYARPQQAGTAAHDKTGGQYTQDMTGHGGQQSDWNNNAGAQTGIAGTNDGAMYGTGAQGAPAAGVAGQNQPYDSAGTQPYDSSATGTGTGAPAAGVGDYYPTQQQEYAGTGGGQGNARTQAPYDSRAPVPGTGAPTTGAGADSHPTQQQAYSVTDSQNRAGNQPYPDNSAAARNIPDYDGPGNAQMQEARHDRPPGEPQHHRDDAISANPNANPNGNDFAADVGRQPTRGAPPEYYSVAGGPPSDVRAQYRGEEVL